MGRYIYYTGFLYSLKELKMPLLVYFCQPPQTKSLMADLIAAELLQEAILSLSAAVPVSVSIGFLLSSSSRQQVAYPF